MTGQGGSDVMNGLISQWFITRPLLLTGRSWNLGEEAGRWKRLLELYLFFDTFLYFFYLLLATLIWASVLYHVFLAMVG